MREHAHKKLVGARADRRATKQAADVPTYLFSWVSAATLSVLAAGFVFVLTTGSFDFATVDRGEITGSIAGQARVPTVPESELYKSDGVNPYALEPNERAALPKTDMNSVWTRRSDAEVQILRDRIDELTRALDLTKADTASLGRRISHIEDDLSSVTGSISAPDQADSTAAAKAPAAPAKSPPPVGNVSLTQQPLDLQAVTAETVGDELAAPAGMPLPKPTLTAKLDNTEAAVTSALPKDVVIPTTQTRFAIDLGRSGTLGEMAKRWTELAAKHGDLLDGLTPLAAIGEDVDQQMEIRLVAGPFDNAADAAARCAAFYGTGLICRPAVYQGQRLVPR